MISIRWLAPVANEFELAIESRSPAICPQFRPKALKLTKRSSDSLMLANRIIPILITSAGNGRDTRMGWPEFMLGELGLSESKTGTKDKQECWEYPPHTTTIELQETKVLTIQDVKNDGRDEKPRNDEENIDADKTASHDLRERVKKTPERTATARSPSMSGDISGGNRWEDILYAKAACDLT